MPEPDGDFEPSPLIQPRLIQRLKQRKRLVDFGFREEVLEQLEMKVSERRDPSVVAEKGVKKAFNEAADATAPPVRERVRSRLEQANEGILEEI